MKRENRNLLISVGFAVLGIVVNEALKRLKERILNGEGDETEYSIVFKERD